MVWGVLEWVCIGLEGVRGVSGVSHGPGRGGVGEAARGNVNSVSQSVSAVPLAGTDEAQRAATPHTSAHTPAHTPTLNPGMCANEPTPTLTPTP